ncbi:MAG: metallopeptidase-like protein [Candidatus Aramenus sulfurataquae]|uniref:Metallopeptidase-like protein n=3 Tax=Candidatus Aramenus sulfurataquae TaxID=1326980 RepID=W7KIG4_9CREN|nr:MAG: metallopeptidase-like protein [Candidatus Aramenus sulfurataquae]
MVFTHDLLEHTMDLEKAEDVRRLAEEINRRVGLGLDLTRVEFLRSRGARTKAVARTLSLPPQWRFVIGEEKVYIVEVISEKFDPLECVDRAFVVLHELLHIPKRMGGGLRSHNSKEFKRVGRLMRKLDNICDTPKS